jgi:hypothetical protein
VYSGVLGGARLFGARARRHLERRLHHMRVRLEHRTGVLDTDGRCAPVLPWSALAVSPGNPQTLPWARADLWRNASCAALAEAVRAHELTLFSPRPVSVSKADAARKARSGAAT